MPSNTDNQVTVTVNAGGRPACSPDPVPARGHDALLTFTLQASGYIFPRDNAVVVSNPGSQFPQPSHTPTDTMATLLDRNTEGGSFKYTVTVQEVGTGRLIELDPTIENETKL
jgi:hypothetical protein